VSGMDGTALWLTLLIPAAERNDVRGRQRAFLILLGPVVTVAAIVLTALAGPGWTWPCPAGSTAGKEVPGRKCGCRSRL
jgi:ABC-2 type transport system permease protein